MTKRITAYILFGLGLLTVTFFRHYGGNIIPYPFLFWLLGFAMYFVGWRLLRSTPTIDQFRKTEARNQFASDLKANGDQIRVDLGKCEVKQNDYWEEKETGNQYANNLGAVYGSRKNIESVEVNQAVVVCRINYRGKEQNYRSEVLPYGRESLLFKMLAQRETTLYIDPADNSRYYLDMEFLDK